MTHADKASVPSIYNNSRKEWQRGARPSRRSGLFIAVFCLLGSGLFFAFAQNSLASPAQGSLTRSAKGSADDMKYNYEMSVDLAAMYLRETRPGGTSDTGGRLNLGGMFNHWIGLDATGMYELKSKSYLVGGNLRLVPINWFYLKVGGGGYFDKLSRELKATPILGAGFKGYFSEYYYMVAEGLSFQTADNERNIAFGVGLGVIF